MSKILNAIFLIYFITHIPATILLDSQAILPSSYYPQAVKDAIQYHIKEFKDPLMNNPPFWFKSFIVVECLFQLPYFFVAIYAFMTGIKKAKWIRIPTIIYAAHVSTTVIPIIAHVALTDFSNAAFGPKTDKERYTLIAIYMPYLLIPIMLLFYMIGLQFDEPKSKSKQQ